jgi:hypothetical protein
MKKLGLVVAVLMLTTPVWARVDIKCANDGNLVTVSYAVVGEPNKVSGFGLNITVDNGAKIKSISDINPKYWVYPGSIAIDTTVTPPVITDYGSPVRDSIKYPGGTLGGLDTNGVSIEMGALYDPPGDNSLNAPGWTGTLLKFRVDKTDNVCVTITEDPTSGGVVLTNPTLNPDVNAPKFCFTFDCLIGGIAALSEKTDWAAWGKPNCWCYQYQCRGDINGKKTGLYRVHLSDLQLLATAYNKTDTALAAIPNGICADINHKKTGLYRVHLTDLAELAKYYNKTDASVPSCDAAPLTTGPYNFWKVP